MGWTVQIIFLVVEAWQWQAKGSDEKRVMLEAFTFCRTLREAANAQPRQIGPLRTTAVERRAAAAAGPSERSHGGDMGRGPTEEVAWIRTIA